MTTPRDDIAGLIEMLRRHYTMSMFVTTDSLIACLIGEREEAATQLDALSARVKELEGLYDRHAELLASEARQITNGRTLYDASNARAEAAEARALRAEQERDEAYERAANVADQQAKDFLSPEYAVHQPIGSICERFACERVAERIRRLASGPEKEKKK